ncbi:hypothetical protein [Sorangium cellulosum]|uniref:hypothetical protein n=1 Tax=Sorangium cellulosum TaxID=56 RepID=UPI000407D686|nr:hypothetical protein [Sorangium cellulosum]
MYGYQLSFTPLAGEADSAASGDLLTPGVLAGSSDDAARLLLYTDVATDAPTLPSFALAPVDMNDFRMFHGSCRKLHGESKDALAILDNIIADALKPGAKDPRPHLLMMSGDQIYADDVADALLFLLMDAADTLLDGREVLPGVKEDDDLRPACRAKVAERMKLTSMVKNKPEHAKSHLLRLGEYYSMYLFAWSDVLWPTRSLNDHTAVFPEYAEIAPPSIIIAHSRLCLSPSLWACWLMARRSSQHNSPSWRVLARRTHPGDAGPLAAAPRIPFIHRKFS